MSHLINFSLLKRNRDFRLIYIGQFVSFIGTMITSVALPYQIYNITHSTLMVGLLSLFQLLPLLFTALIGGVLADRYPRRMMLLISETFLALGCLGLAINSIGTPHLWLVFVIAVIMSALTGLHRPALDSMLQQVVKKEDFPQLGSLSSLKFSVGAIGGPALGGFLIAFFGISLTYIIDFFTFAISLSTILLLSHVPPPSFNQNETAWSSLKGGIKYAGSKQELMGTYIVDFVAMIFGMPTALFPAMATSFGGVKTLGILYAAPAMVALIISFLSGWTYRIKRQGLAIALAAICWGIAIIFFGLAPHFWMALLFLAAAGAADAISGILRMTMWNEIIPNEYRGRLSGIEMISYLSGPRLGDMESGLVAAAFGITASIVSGGVLCVVGVILTSAFMPKFLKYNSAVYIRQKETLEF